MPSKKHELSIINKCIGLISSELKIPHKVDLNYLNLRNDNENPDIYIFDKNRPTNKIKVEITYAEDTESLEKSERTMEKAIEKTKLFLKSLIGTPNFFVGYNIETVPSLWSLGNDFQLLSDNLNKFRQREYRSTELRKIGFRVINYLAPRENGSSLFMLGGPSENKKLLFLNYGYFERLEMTLKREIADYQRKGKKNCLDTVLLMETNLDMRDEIEAVKYTFDDLESIESDLLSLASGFKEVYVVENVSPGGHIYNIRSLINLIIQENIVS